MAAPAGRTRYVGRRLELSTIRQGLQAAVEGRGGLALITGEPGIGKTRLAEETAAEAEAQGVRVCWGRCSDDEGAPAYWPWLQILRECLRDPAAGPLLTAMGLDAATLAPLLPDPPRAAGTTPALPDPAQRRFRLVDVVTRFLIRLAAARPLLLVFDDLHRADRPSLSLLRFLTQDERDARLFVLVTARDGEAEARHPAAADLAALARGPTARRIALGGLSGDDMARLMEWVTGRRPSAALAAAVKQQTEGNPFFVEEVARQLAAEGLLDRPLSPGLPVRLPHSVQEVAEQWLDRLSEACRRVLTVA
ncbi:MAG: ATP-binding protein, partial [Dehalococcoidia bacterium]